MVADRSYSGAAKRADGTADPFEEPRRLIASPARTYNHNHSPAGSRNAGVCGFGRERVACPELLEQPVDEKGASPTLGWQPSLDRLDVGVHQSLAGLIAQIHKVDDGVSRTPLLNHRRGRVASRVPTDHVLRADSYGAPDKASKEANLQTNARGLDAPRRECGELTFAEVLP